MLIIVFVCLLDPGYFLIKSSNHSISIAELKDYNSFVAEADEVFYSIIQC